MRDGEPFILGHLDAHPADPRDVEIVQREKRRDEPAWKRKKEKKEKKKEFRTSRNQNKS